ncbi:MAG: DNA/RNA non-specific endonuclease [Bacteroidales bacterium]|nr:DNA/RNA non-specific endonuclease [Bacteroidales bacterium]
MYSSTGATLSGSYTGASATPTAVGFKYGTVSGSLNQTISATDNSGSLSATLTGLTAGTPYYYKAFVTVNGTGDYASQSQTFYGAEYSFTTKAVATATVTTNAATSVTSSTARLNANFSGATGTINDRGFRYKKGNGSWETPDGLGSTNGTSGSFYMDISSLDASSTYTFQAYVTEWDENENAYVDHWADNTQSFTTGAAVTPTPAGGWLELPEVTGSEDFVGKFYGSGSSAGTNRNYSYSYNYTYYAAMWVAYPLTFAHTQGSSGSKNWSYNPNIAQNKQVSITSKSYPTMYNASAYARGHQIPNASRYSNTQMNDQTYYATNQTPQLQNKFNASIWGDLEAAVRGFTQNYSDTVYVVTGPLYRKAGGSETINYLTGTQSANPSSLPIPNYYWKALLKVTRNGNGDITGASTIGFWYDHREYESSEKYNDSEHIVSVNQIEQWTGLNLFHNLPDSIEETAESNTSLSAFESSANIASVSGKNWGSF